MSIFGNMGRPNSMVTVYKKKLTTFSKAFNNEAEYEVEE